MRRFPKLDGAIIFSDILVILDALGCGVVIPEGGPRLTRTLDQLDPAGPLDERVFEPVQAALRKVRAAPAGAPGAAGLRRRPLDPLRLRHGGQGQQELDPGQGLPAPGAGRGRGCGWTGWRTSPPCSLNLHIGAGAQGVQLFDTWAGELDREDF